MKNNTIIRAGDRFTKNAAAKTESKKTAMDNLLSLIAKPEACLNSPRLLPLERAMDALAYQEFSATHRFLRIVFPLAPYAVSDVPAGHEKIPEL